jgi:hypothetical protein
MITLIAVSRLNPMKGKLQNHEKQDITEKTARASRFP